MSLPVAAVPQVVRISEVSETTVNWKTLVHVLESHRVRVVQMNGTSKAFRRFEFGDSQGITVAAVVYDDDISHVDGLLLPFKKYYISAVELCEILESTPPDAEAQALQKISISNAEVRAAAERFQPDGLKLQWIISTKTVVEEIDEADSSVLPFHFDFTAYKDLPLYADMKYETIDVIGIVIHASAIIPIHKDSHELLVQKIWLVNEEMNPILLSLWNEFTENQGKSITDLKDKHPVVICHRLNVVMYNGMTRLFLSTHQSEKLIN
ncbi:uncharacterized protein [Coffea arabica]|uniref:Uncharacterized protein isoform X1 n=1 Tax=Coffea arabica TaxID=13443 RepID=A0ABM4WS78_COFAR